MPTSAAESFMSRPIAVSATALLLAVLPAAAQDKPQFAGPTASGFLLPIGWTLSPAGQHVVLSDLPLNIRPLADGKHVLISTNGYNKHELTLIDLATRKVVARDSVRESWFGLALTEPEDRIWWAGG